ncbi:MAG: paraquat-inducible protein A [Planctomycetes bacterium]|nr:paraquat-inducible protein A [Planctomycetota bacterium]
MTAADPDRLRACSTCGLVQRVPALAEGELARCARCDGRVAAGAPRDNGPAFAATLAALALYPLAISLPVLRLEQLGHAHEASVWSGSLGLLREGQWAVGAVVFLCSVVLPLAKLLGLAFLCTSERFATRHRARFYHAVELVGRWGMLDVLLVALVVAWVKVGDLVDVTPGPGVLAFTLCVLASLLASARFDPHVLWERPEEARGVPS